MHALDTLDAATRRTVEAFMNQFTEQKPTGFGDLFAEEGVFEGAFTGGVLQGRATIEFHMRQVVRRFFCDGMMQYHGVAVVGRQVVLDWEFLRAGEAEIQSVAGRTTLDMDESGLIQKMKVAWNPRELMV